MAKASRKKEYIKGSTALYRAVTRMRSGPSERTTRMMRNTLATRNSRITFMPGSAWTKNEAREVATTNTSNTFSHSLKKPFQPTANMCTIKSTVKNTVYPISIFKKTSWFGPSWRGLVCVSTRVVMYEIKMMEHTMYWTASDSYTRLVSR